MGKDLNGKNLGKGITQRKDMRYMYRYNDVFGKQCTKYADTEREIKKIKRDIEYEKEHSIYTDTAKITLNVWYEFWINKKRRQKKSKTAKNYSYYYNSYIRNKLGMIYMSDITSIMCQELFDELINDGIAHSSIHMVKGVINQLYNEAIANGKTLSNPIIDNMYCGEKKQNEKIALSEAEEEEFLSFAEKSNFYYLFVLAFETGLRIGELAALSVNSINLNKNVLYVKRTFNFDKDENEPFYTEPKTKNSIRVVPLSNKAQIAIKHQLLRRQAIPSSNAEFDDLLFRNRNGNPLNHRETNRACKRIVNRINKNREYVAKETGECFKEFPNMHIHITRHTFATKCVRKGMKPEFLQRIMGHSTITTTLGYYVHLNEDDLINAMNQIDEQSQLMVNGNELLPFNVSKVCQNPHFARKIG